MVRTMETLRLVFQRIWKGMHNHPGTFVIFWITILGFFAGFDGGESLVKGLMGSLVMFLVFGPIYLFSSYQRGKDSS